MTDKVRVKADAIVAKDLKPGDLFSIADSNYWNRCMDVGGVGEIVFVRTNLPSSVIHDSEIIVYKLTIEVVSGN